MREGGILTYLHTDHLGSASLATDATGGVASEMRYYPYGQTRSGTMDTDRRYTGQRWEAGIGLYDYNARYYDPALGRFVQADTIVPSPANPQSYNRYTYVENNPLKYIDPYGFEKVIITYGTGYSEETNSFYAAAYTQYQCALADGYSEEDILFFEQGITTDTELLDAIRQSDIGEIERLYYFGHGWYDEEDEVGGLQISSGDTGTKQFTSGDIDITLMNRFSDNAAFHIRACQVGKSSLPQEIADAWNITVYASRRSMKFFKMYQATPFDYPQMTLYSGGGEYDPDVHVEMHPYIFGALTVGRVNLRLPSWAQIPWDSNTLIVDVSIMFTGAYVDFQPQ
jgi:RHS repeat-associated protein